MKGDSTDEPIRDKELMLQDASVHRRDPQVFLWQRRWTGYD